jgi:phosphohistidine phosphatase SixA
VEPVPSDTAVPEPTVPTATPEPTEDTSVLARLRRGGLVIYLRHTRTNWDHDELPWVEEVLEDASLFDDCDRQRQLTDEGRQQARDIGGNIRRLGIPVGQVLTSPWCRTRETADLAFGGGSVARDKLFDTGYLDDGDERERYERELRGLLSDAPGGGNRVIVGHMPQLSDATGIQLEEAEAAIFLPKGGGFDTLAKHVGPGDWDGLAGR